MTTPARKPAANHDVMLLIGQLLEATKAASEAIKETSNEVQGNAKAIIATAKTLEKVEDMVGSLDEIIRDIANPNNLVTVTQAHATKLSTLADQLVQFRADLDRLRDSVASINKADDQTKSVATAVWGALKVSAWVLTTAIAAYAAVSSGK